MINNWNEFFLDQKGKSAPEDGGRGAAAVAMGGRERGGAVMVQKEILMHRA